MSIKSKKEWLDPQVVSICNNSIKSGNPTAYFQSELYADNCTGTCATPIYTISGTNSTMAFCYSGSVAICS